MNDKSTFMEIMRLQPYGTLMYDIISVDGQNWEVSFFIKEDETHMALYTNNPNVEIVMGIIEEEEASPVVAIININGCKDLMYETWLNFYAELGEKVFEYLICQEKIKLHLINGRNNIVRSISVNNGLKKWLLNYIQRIKGRKRWSMTDFDVAKDKICCRYPDIRVLYNRLLHSIQQAQ